MNAPQSFRAKVAATVVVLLVLFHGAAACRADSPIAVTRILRNGTFASFLNSQHPGNRIGYRFHEHRPYVFGDVPAVDTTTAAAVKLAADFDGRVGTVVNSLEIGEHDENWVKQLWTFFLHPVEDGIELL